jgi:NitT/TauT family transport system substrate-binding protein
MPCELLREQPAVVLHWLFALTPAFRMPEDFHGKKVASPQFGNTQDIAFRDWLSKHGLKPRERGGDVQITPIANPDQLTLFLRKHLDAAWAPNPGRHV